jgi:hypothetical protein
MTDPTSEGKAEPTWGPYPGDRLVPPPTPQAPEIPMSEGWLVAAGAAVVLRYALIAAVVVIAVLVVVALIAHW